MTAVLRLKELLLEQPHAAPLTRFVEDLRAERGQPDVPWFDPLDAGVNARVLILLEKPSRRSSTLAGSGFISVDNPDETAHLMFSLQAEAGLSRAEDTVSWNIVPWYLGDEERDDRRIRVSDLDEAEPSLRRLLSLLPNLRAVVLLGRDPQTGWGRAERKSRLVGENVQVFCAPHPGRRSVNSNPEARGQSTRGVAQRGERRSPDGAGLDGDARAGLLWIGPDRRGLSSGRTSTLGVSMEALQGLKARLSGRDWSPSSWNAAVVGTGQRGTDALRGV